MYLIDPPNYGHYHFPQRDNAGVMPRIPARKLLRNHEFVEGQHEQQPAYGRAVPRYRQRSGRIRRRKSERWPKAGTAGYSVQGVQTGSEIRFGIYCDLLAGFATTAVNQEEGPALGANWGGVRHRAHRCGTG